MVLVMGPPAAGKSSSLMGLNQERYVYLNCDLKEIPFADNFAAKVDVTDPYDIFDYIQEIEENDDIDGVILDTITFLMDMVETQYVVTAKDTRAAWGSYAKYYKDLLHAIKSGTKDYIILAHEAIEHNEELSINESKVPVKGAVGRTGVEADFTTIVSCRALPIRVVKSVENDLLNITEDEEEDGTKHVFVTRVHKNHAGGKQRSPIGLWDRSELYIDNNVNNVLTRIKQFYA